MKTFITVFLKSLLLILLVGSSVFTQTLISIDDSNIWTEFASNPLFGGPTDGVDRGYYPVVLKVGSTYHIWYGDGTNTRHATSTNANFSGAAFPALACTGLPTGAYHPRVLYNANGWTVGGNFYAGPFLMYSTTGPSFTTTPSVAFSADGDSWTDIGPTTGVIGPDAYYMVYNFDVLYEGGTTWKAYADNGWGWILYYTSIDGLNWTGVATNIVGPPLQSWEPGTNTSPHVIKADDYYVIFYGSGTTSNNQAIGMAMSTDGQNFTKSIANPLLSISGAPAWRDNRTYTPYVFQDESDWKMYFTGKSTVGGNYSIGYATNGSLFQYIEDAMVVAGNDDIVDIGSGIYNINSTINLNKSNLTFKGAGSSSTIIKVSGTGERFNITAAGTTLRDLQIEKTDKVGVQNIIYLGANNITIRDNMIFGHFTIGDGDVSRAMVMTYGLSGLVIEGNTIYALRQPAYINGSIASPTTGNITNNYIYGTKGWVVDGANMTFSGNTWGVNVYDIAILGSTDISYYPNIVTVSEANNDAVIEDQRVVPAVLSVVHVDAVTSYSSDLGGRYHPYQTITPAITRVVAGGKISVAAGTYNEDVVVPTSLKLFSTSGRTTTIINGQTAGWGGGALRINSSNVTVGGAGKGFTFNSKTGGSATTLFTCYISGARDNLLIEENKFVAAAKDPGNNESYGLLTDGGQTNQTFLNNIFDGLSTPRFLIYVNGFADVGVASTNIDFIGNTFISTAGGLSLSSSGGEIAGNHFQGAAGLGLSQYANNTITGNYFEGTRTHFSLNTLSGVDADAVIASNTILKQVVIRMVTGYREEVYPWGNFIVVRANIQDAIDAATAGDSVLVSEGTYNETVQIGKAVILLGTGKTQTIVQPTIGLSTGLGHKYDGNMTVAFLVNNAAGVIVEGMAIDGNELGLNAVMFWNGSSGTIQNLKIMRPMVFSGMQTGQGLAVDATTPNNVSLNIKNCDFEQWNKNAIDIVNGNGTTSNGGDITFNVDACIFTGRGNTTSNAQNCIVVWERAGGTINGSIQNSAFSGVNYTPASDDASAILQYGSPNGLISPITGCSFTNTEIYFGEAGGSNHDLLLTGNIFDGIDAANATVPQLAVIEDRIIHKMDDNSVGLVTFRLKNVVATPNNLGVQQGVNVASLGDTVVIADGTYEEQVEVTKQLVLCGESMVSSIIKSPVSLTKFFVTSGTTNNYPVVYVHDVAGVGINKLTVDGAGRGNSNYRFIGIGYRNAGGLVKGCNILNIKETPINGNQHGVAMYAFADDGNTRNLSVENNTIIGFQKNGTVFAGNNLIVSVKNNTITGGGAISFTAQNGLQISTGASGILNGNVLTGFSYTPATWTSVGVLVYNATSPVIVSNNIVSECQVGIYYLNTDGSIYKNNVSNTIGGMDVTPSWWGIVVDPGIEASRLPKLSGFDLDNMISPNRLTPNSIAVLNTTVDSNSLNGGGKGIGIEADAYGTETLNLFANNNAVTNWEDGFVLFKEYEATLSSVLRKNKIAGNKYGVLDQSGVLQDAKENWWGSPSGPADPKTLPNTPNYNNPAGLGDSVSNFIDYNPWYLENELTNISIYTLTISATNGSVEKDPNLSTYNHGTFVQLTPKADEGYHFIGWSGEIPIGHEADNPLIVTMDQNRTITANFGKSSYSLTINAMHGTVGVDPPAGPYDYGTVVTLTATPDNRSWGFKDWSGDTTGSASPLYLIMNRDKNITANFIRDSAYLITYRSFTAESLAIDKDVNGKIGKYVLPKAYIVEFRCLIPNNMGQSVKNLHLHFSPELIQNRVEYPFVIEPVPSQIKFVSKGVLDLSWGNGINTGDTVRIHGWGMRGKLEKIRFAWHAYPGGIHGWATFLMNKLQNPMPNRVNAVYETFRQHGFSDLGGLLVGRARQDSVRYYGWLLAPNYNNVMQTFYSRNRIHDGQARGFDVYTINYRPLVGKQKSLPAYKYNNKLLADMIALKLNITSSQLDITPYGFGELIFDEGGTNPLNGMTVEEIAYNVDSAMMGYYKNGQHMFAGPAVLDQLYRTVNLINKAFEGPIDTLGFVSGLKYKGVHPLVDVSYLRANPHAIIKTLIPVVDDIQGQPVEYKLYQNFPNPFNPTTTIQFDLPEDGLVTLKIFNVLGQEVKTLIEREMMGSGTEEIEFQAENLTSGVYFYRISVEVISDQEDESFIKTFTSVKKMLLLK
jgi:parallel beta-helix repeat protein